MKKYLVFVLTLIIAIGVAGCSGKEEDKGTKTTAGSIESSSNVEESISLDDLNEEFSMVETTVKEETIEAHEMHSEHFYIKQEDVEKINKAKKEGRRVIAVGTTSCRVLESIADENGEVKEIETDTEIFIYPGYKFKCMDGLITNFHLPESTLIMLVSALAGRENVLNAYRTAVEEKYRFFSFGDAMMIE